jgi:methyl-accepting chemotaxis protein
MKKSIKTKLLLSIVPSVIVTMLILVIILIKMVNDSNEKLAYESSFETTRKYSNLFNGEFQSNLSLIKSLAKTIEENKSSSREEFNRMLYNFLESNPQFLSTSMCFEPNSLDGNDTKYANTSTNDENGRFIPYWIRENNSIVQAELTGYNDPASDWYYVPKNTKQPYITKPLLYNNSLIVSYCIPIIRNGKFIGAAFADQELNYINKSVSEIKLFDTGYAFIVDDQGTYIADKDTKKIGTENLLKNAKTDKNLFEIADVITNKEEHFVNAFSEQLNTDAVMFPAKIPLTKWYLVSVVPEDEIMASVNHLIYMLIILSVVIVLLISGLIYVITNKITQPINKALVMINELSKGHLSTRVNSDSQDEFGQMTKAMDEFANKLQVEIVGSMKKIASGDLNVEINSNDHQDEISPALNQTIGALNGLINESKLLIEAATHGRLETRGDAKKFSGAYQEIVIGVNTILDEVIKPINEAEKVLSKMAQGDLAVQMTGEYQGDYLKFKDNINNLASSFNEAITQVTEAVQATASAATQISSSAEEMASGAQEQSMQASEIAAAVEQMTKTIYETTENTNHASDASKNAKKFAYDGGKIVDDTITGMNKISEVVIKSAETVKELGNSSNKIGNIIQVIDEIADQTNLLALNAAIESARAGEQGRGFAVVADEVRKLAERTSNATKEIAVMISQIQKDTNTAVESMIEGTEKVEQGKNLAVKAGQSLKEIIKGNEQVVDLITQVAAASEEQSATSDQISKNITTISNVTQESASGLQQIAHASEDLNKLTVNLQNLVSKFKLVSVPKNEMYNIENKRKKVSSYA